MKGTNTNYYRFYFNVDTGEFLQMYYNDCDVTEGFFHEKLEEIAGKWSDCYMPISLGCTLGNAEIALPQDIPEIIWSKEFRLWTFDETVFEQDTIYPATDNDMLSNFYYPTKPNLKNEPVKRS